VVGVSSSSRVKLGWEVPDAQWSGFTEKVEEEWGEARLYAGIQIEESWREYRDIHPLEDHANRLLEAAGLSRETGEEKNLPGVPPLANTESSRQFVRVQEDVKQEMEQYAAAHGLSKHEVLRGVIAWYLDGGREERLLEKFDRVVPEAERVFAEATDDGPDTADGLSKSERVTRQIARSLGDSFSEADLVNAIDAETTGTDYYHDEYAPRVVDYKGVKRWERENGPDVFLTPEAWTAKQTTEIVSELGGDYETNPPAFTREEFARAADRAGLEVSPENRETVNEYKDRVLERLEFEWSDETEKFEPLTDRGEDDVDAGGEDEAVTAADQMDALSATRVRSEVFDGHSSKRTAKELMGRAARVDGFETDGKGGEKRLRCDLETVTDDGLLADADLTAGTAGGGPDESDANPGVDAVDTDGTDPETVANEEIDTLMAATPVTDGGKEQP
jgi:hypothetical protein